MGSLAEARSLSTVARKKRAQVKSDLKSGHYTLEVALGLPAQLIGNLPVYELLKVMPGIGPTRLSSIGNRAIDAGVNLFLPVVALTTRQRAWLVRTCYNVTEARRKEGS